ncbi:MipA/OmpV family protein [Flavobacterium sp. W21_SRS_FM6]|uniref:MipA/OmpV family protein n=1 Tax=Flavobacterium sp. W21_SRS_FM6 TaxID=3240268 RepID=UPI003F926755
MTYKQLGAVLFTHVLLSGGVLAQESEGENRRQVEQHGWLYGLGVALDQGVYKGFDTRVLPLPLIGYRSENLTVFGPFVNYHFYRQAGFEFSARLVPVFEGYDESDSDVFIGMQDRDFSLALGLGASYQFGDLKFEVNGAHDVLNRSDGYEMGFSMSKVYRHGPVFIEPSVSLGYQDSHYVDYYYGVQASEATSTRAQYTGKSALNKTIGVSVMTPVFFNGMTRFSVENIWYDDAIADSPLTDTDSSIRVMLTYSRFF